MRKRTKAGFLAVIAAAVALSVARCAGGGPGAVPSGGGASNAGPADSGAVGAGSGAFTSKRSARDDAADRRATADAAAEDALLGARAVLERGSPEALRGALARLNAVGGDVSPERRREVDAAREAITKKLAGG